MRINNKEYYINPYNFITLPEKCERKKSKDRQGNLNGYMECILKAETPIMIPDTNNVKIEKVKSERGDKKLNHKEYGFFNYGQNNGNFTIPVIPGSEIRGMLRSDYETFTDSCMSTLNKDISFIYRTTEKRGKLPGILEKDENGNWKLYEAKRYVLHTCRKDEGTPREASGDLEAIYLVDKDNKIENNGKIFTTGQKVKFSFKKNSTYTVLKIGEGDKEGILFLGETGGRKTKNKIHDSIFVSTGKKIEIKDLNQEVKKLEAIYDMYNDKAFNQKIKANGKTWYAGYDIKHGKTLPVWYSKPTSENKTYLSLASIGKEAYHRTLSELVGDFMPCIDRENVCNCCNVFGFVSDNDADSSKIRISDAVYELDENPYENKMTIKELASPHIANATFYALYAPDTGFENMPQNFDFNYDVRIDQNGKHEIRTEDISIRGRKQYWHHKDIKEAISKIQNERNCTVTPVKKDTEFKFKIYFNDLSRENLEELIAIINLEFDEKHNLGHKIGKGKPLGFGSCKLKVQEVYLKDVSIQNGELKYELKDYNTYFGDDNFKLEDISLAKFQNMDTISMKEALRIYDLDYIEKNYSEAKVQYPMASKNGKEASMYWFILNKSTNMRESYVIMVLPRIIDGKDENGNEKNPLTDIKVNHKTIGKTHGILLPRYESNE